MDFQNHQLMVTLSKVQKWRNIPEITYTMGLTCLLLRAMCRRKIPSFETLPRRPLFAEMFLLSIVPGI